MTGQADREAMSTSEATRARPRPLSPHLTVYRFIPTMAMSIAHRITGGALYFGMLVIAWWLIAAATSEGSFRFANTIIGSWFGLLVMAAFTWSLIHHLLGGIKHLVWDTGHAMEKHISTRIAHATWIGSLTLTALLWVGIYIVHR